MSNLTTQGPKSMSDDIFMKKKKEIHQFLNVTTSP